MPYEFKKIESKWRKKWEEKNVFEVKENPKRKKFYCLDMFPYPSGTGLHMGHAFVFSLGDIFARFKRMQGFNVLYPIGYDALGLPAENAAIKVGTHPEEYTKKSIVNFMKQQKAMGWSYDWSRMINTSTPEYYKWDQWLFLQMMKKGIAYRKKAPVNFCKKCDTVLANEQVVNGKCWRHDDTEVEIKNLEQWFFKITDYAEELLKGLDKLDWPERAKTMQRNWIGKSEGAEIIFEIENKKYPIFTTRPDTLFGVTFLVVSAQHPELANFVKQKQKKDVENFLKKIKSTKREDVEKLDKEGVFSGSFAIHPLTKEKIPVWIGNFVLAEYGSGIVMAVPGHDQRDLEFAKKYNLPIKVVIKPETKEIEGIEMDEAYISEGKLVNSREFNDLFSEEAKEHIVKALEAKKLGRKVTQYKLRDWLVSRQRYWGTPIPVVYCGKCGIVPVSENDLPVKLPHDVKFGKGNPLATNEKWINVKCPRCGKPGRRETDTMDTFVNSSWYYLRYADPRNDKKIFETKKANYWAPIDQYIGGPEHITAHLIYARFYTKFLADLGLIKLREPALRYFTQGLVRGSDGEKMSKSKGNVVEPLETINKFGADSLRLYLVSNSSSDRDFDWSEKEIQSSFNFTNKVCDYFANFKAGKSDARVKNKLNRTIKEVTLCVEDFAHNLAAIKIRNLFSYFHDKKIDKETAESFLKMLHIYCPFITEELWEILGNKGFISLAEWPKCDEKKINEKFEKEEKAVEQLVDDINNILKIMSERKKAVKKIFIYTLPNEKEMFSGNLNFIAKKTSHEVRIFAVNDKDKYDPEKKSSKAKLGKPAIYAE